MLSPWFRRGQPLILVQRLTRSHPRRPRRPRRRRSRRHRRVEDERLRGLVGGDRRAHGGGEVVGHRRGERAAGVPVGAGVRRARRLLAGLDAVLLRPLVGHAEGHRPRDVGGVELLAAGEVEAGLRRVGGQDPAEAADPRPQLTTGSRTPGARPRSRAARSAKTANRPGTSAITDRSKGFSTARNPARRHRSTSRIPPRPPSPALTISPFCAGPALRGGLEAGQRGLQLLPGRHRAVGGEGPARHAERLRGVGRDRVELLPAARLAGVGDRPAVGVVERRGALLGGLHDRGDERLAPTVSL